MMLPVLEWSSTDTPPSRNWTALWVAMAPGAFIAAAAAPTCALIPCPVPVGPVVSPTDAGAGVLAGAACVCAVDTGGTNSLPVADSR
eukprot:1148536-Karenia_brevis.AAC.1